MTVELVFLKDGHACLEFKESDVRRVSDAIAALYGDARTLAERAVP